MPPMLTSPSYSIASSIRTHPASAASPMPRRGASHHRLRERLVRRGLRSRSICDGGCAGGLAEMAACAASLSANDRASDAACEGDIELPQSVDGRDGHSESEGIPRLFALLALWDGWSPRSASGKARTFMDGSYGGGISCVRPGCAGVRGTPLCSSPAGGAGPSAPVVMTISSSPAAWPAAARPALLRAFFRRLCAERASRKAASNTSGEASPAVSRISAPRLSAPAGADGGACGTAAVAGRPRALATAAATAATVLRGAFARTAARTAAAIIAAPSAPASTAICARGGGPTYA